MRQQLSKAKDMVKKFRRELENVALTPECEWDYHCHVSYFCFVIFLYALRRPLSSFIENNCIIQPNLFFSVFVMCFNQPLLSKVKEIIWTGAASCAFYFFDFCWRLRHLLMQLSTVNNATKARHKTAYVFISYSTVNQWDELHLWFSVYISRVVDQCNRNEMNRIYLSFLIVRQIILDRFSL